MAAKVKYVLSIDGGGIRGLIPAMVLEEVEKRVTDKVKTKAQETLPKDGLIRIADLFDFVAGTSTGSILALGLTVNDEKTSRPKYEAKDLRELYETRGEEIFDKTLATKIFSIVGKYGDLLLNGAAKYNNENLIKILDEHFGEAKLNSDIVNNIKVLVPSYDITINERHYFKNYGSTKNSVKLKDAVQASSAAPSYFRAKKLDDDFYVDGGVFMNNPALRAYTDSVMLFKGSKIVVCSLGTGFYKEATIAWLENAGTLKVAEPIVALFMHQQTASTDYNMIDQQKISDGKLTYHRFQEKFEKDIGLDSTDSGADLKSAAKRIIGDEGYMDNGKTVTREWLEKRANYLNIDINSDLSDKEIDELIKAKRKETFNKFVEELSDNYISKFPNTKL
ncbi:7822_t:CDS:1 [Diversispora eburnea]|uniref:7822_t:CDS:1 n=1 Tax=Diversispora eburnea TaxID=1213867 RepID=A0A9N8WS48_9GLOM|nr:7822_t:CDS:1 [Diversispora eburnea]